MALEIPSMFKEANIQTAGEHTLCPKVRVLGGLVLVYWGREEEPFGGTPWENGIRPLLPQLAVGETADLMGLGAGLQE